ncbi:MAG: TetR/AcrR family transcriptional regulator [Pyrinomonadaceae bacterium]
MARTINGKGAVERREEILRAAIKVFASKGYFNSKVADIAAQAKIADGTVYLYFKGKEHILHSIFDRAMERFISEGKEELAKLGSAEKKLRRIAELHLERMSADKNLAIVFQVQLRASIKFMREFSSAGFAQYLEIIREAFEEGQKMKVFKKDLSPVVCSKIFFGALDEMVTNWILSGRKYELRPMADEVMKVFMHGVAA